MEEMRWAMISLVVPGSSVRKEAPDGGVGGHIHGGGGVVQIRIFGFFQDGPGNAEPLPLTAGEVAAALADLSVS